LNTPVAAVAVRGDGVEVTCRDGSGHRAEAVVVAVPLNALGAIEFDPPLPDDKQAEIALGQASRGVKLMLRARGEAISQGAIRPGHPFGYLATEELEDDGTQLLIGFGLDAERCDPADLAGVQRDLDTILPGYQAVAATTHDWLRRRLAR